MYFNHAFQKSFLPVSGDITLKSSGTTADLQAGEIGFFNASTFAYTTTGTAVPFVLAQGSWFKNTSDKIGPFHGGYQESVKSKVINPKYITRLIKIEAQDAANQIKTVSVCNLKCDHTYRLRLDMKGSPALRFLSHNIYRVLDAYSGCCADPDVETIVDPTTIVINWAKQIVNNPILSQYVKLEVLDWGGATVGAAQASTSQADIATFVAGLDAYVSSFDPTAAGAATSQASLIITVAYVETKFGNCTFTPTDKYDLEPLRVFASMVDESGDPCNVQCFTTTGSWTNGVYTPDTQEPHQAQGVGETVLRDMILTGRYRQEAYPDSSRVESLRMREIEANPGLAQIDRINGMYDQVLILHSVPRFNNPTGTFDNDQYLLKIWVDQGADTTPITDFIVAACTAAGNSIPVNAAGVTFELY